jgi:hypothetical protein
MYSSNGTLKLLNGVSFLIKVHHSNAFFSFLLCKKLMWTSCREKYKGILALHILLSQTMDPRRKMSYSQIKMCNCVEH